MRRQSLGPLTFCMCVCVQAHYRPVGIDGKLKDLWAEVAAQTRKDAVASVLITRETGVADADTLARAAAARLAPQWDRSHRNGGPGAPHWHFLPYHSFSHANLKSPCAAQA